MNPRRMLVGSAIGAALGLIANLAARGAPWLGWVTDNVATPVGQIFLRLLFMLVVPLLFSALAVGVTGLEVKQLGRLGLRTLGYAVVVSLIAVVIGLVLVNLVRPGEGAISALALAKGRPGLPTSVAPQAPTAGAAALIVGMVPDNVVKAAANGDMIGVIVFALVFGVALALTPSEAVLHLRQTLQGLYDVMMTCIDFVLRLAPVGVGALLFTMAARLGLDLLRPLAAYVLVVLVGLALHLFVVYSILLRTIAGMSPRFFFRAVRLAMVTAFSTSSSSATLPTALKVAEENLRLPTDVSRFVLTVGSTMNQNGTALYEGITVLFLAQLAGVPLGLGQQALVMVIAVLAGVGTAGVPAGSLPVLALILEMFHIPPEGLALIFGVDRFLDMCRTTLNVTGDLVVAACVAKTHRAAQATEDASGAS